VALERTDAIIAGVNKAGTTSLFVSLSTHPDVAPSSVKETRYFLPARYGQPLAPISVWDDYFAPNGSRPVHLEATPSYFYGGDHIAPVLRDRTVNPHVIVVLREPVSRAISFFSYQKVRLRIPADCDIVDYLATADRLGPDAFLDPANERYMAFRGGCYAEFLPSWLDAFGTERLLVLDFARLIADPEGTVRDTAARLGLDPAAFPATAASSENRTTGFRFRGLQQLALAGNDRLEVAFRRRPAVKRSLRSFYYRLNGRNQSEAIPDAVRAELAARYGEANARLAAQLDAVGITRPGWLGEGGGGQTSSGART